jgi:hypothetical protein
MNRSKRLRRERSATARVASQIQRPGHSQDRRRGLAEGDCLEISA